MGTEYFPETAARLGNDGMVAFQHCLVHREIADAAEEDDKNIHGFDISAFLALVIWSKNNPSICNLWILLAAKPETGVTAPSSAIPSADICGVEL